jgi:hypothetical protein
MPAAPRREDHAQKSAPSSIPQGTNGGQASAGRRPLLLWVAAALGLFLLAAGIEAVRLMNDPHVYFLPPDGSAEWIRLDQEFSLNLYPPSQTGLLFEYPFHTSQPVSGARLTVRAFRRCVVTLDQARLYVSPEDLDTWQEPRQVRLPEPIGAGDHVLQIAVLNNDDQPCLLAYSNQLPIRTGPDWFVTQQGGRRSRAITVTDRTQPPAALTYPSVAQRAGRVVPWLLAIFAAAFGWTYWTGHPSAGVERRRLRPRHVRWGLLAAWLVLSAYNIGQLPWRFGYDMNKHLEYVQYIAERHRIPLANESWEMFQPPLFYLLEAPVYALLSPHFSIEVLARVLRFLPLLCGLAQIEIVYRTARAVFPEKDDLQIVATLVGGLLPVHIYISQLVSNESLAGALSAVTVLLCICLLVEPARARSKWYFAALGGVWALAILSKVTPLLLAPLIVGAIAVAGQSGGGTLRQSAQRSAIACGTCFLICGWYFLRNMAAFGKPIVANWDPVVGVTWWQEPGYRTWTQLTSFGTALSRPIYGGIWSLWDGLYSSLWIDSFVSGRIVNAPEFPWNLNWTLAGAWLALTPTALLLASPATCWRSEVSRSRNALLFALAAVAIYLAAIADFYLRVPIYSAAHARFMVGLLPCFGVLAAAGAAPLLRVRLLRAIVLALVACWAIAAYVASFDYEPIRRLLAAGS